MSDFLQFLNTADIDSLTKIPGITPTLGENLIAARPFASVEDCLRVRGMGKSLLSRAQTAYETDASKPDESNSDKYAVIPVEPEAAPIEKSQPVKEAPPEKKSSMGARVGQALLGFLRALLRLILLVLVIGGAGAAIYYGAPVLYQKFIAPVEQNTARVSELENEVTSLQTQLTDVNNRMTEINGRMDNIEQSIEAHTASLEKLEAIQSTLERQIKDNQDQTMLELKNEVMLTRILDMLSRARLYLAQSNFGLAKEDVQSAHDLLAELNSGLTNEVQSQAVTRLEQTLRNLPEFPVVASGDLEIAWQILITGKTVATPTPEPTGTQIPTPISTLESTLTPTATP